MKAKELLNKEGYTKDNPLKFNLYITDRNQNKRVAYMIVSNWNRLLPVKSSVIIKDFSEYVKDIDSNKYGVYSLIWNSNLYPIDLFFKQWAEEDNISGFYNLEYKDLIQKMNLSADIEDKLKLYETMEKILLKSYNVSPILFYKNIAYKNQKYTNIVPNATSIHKLNFIQAVDVFVRSSDEE